MSPRNCALLYTLSNRCVNSMSPITDTFVERVAKDYVPRKSNNYASMQVIQSDETVHICKRSSKLYSCQVFQPAKLYARSRCTRFANDAWILLVPQTLPQLIIGISPSSTEVFLVWWSFRRALDKHTYCTTITACHLNASGTDD
eukprot:1693301-Pleurochrysis_carterae.AAC.3